MEINSSLLVTLPISGNVSICKTLKINVLYKRTYY